MAWWEWLVGVILFIVALGVLIGIHELGHLSAAKLFNVYCFNYSIGFGPKIIASKRSKKHETIWSLRAIPLGGFVSMYGEGSENDTGDFIPPSRSLEGVARYKRAVIVSAGVILNFILGYVLIFIHNAAFDHVYFTFYNPNAYQTSMVCNVNDELKTKGIEDGDYLKLAMDPLAGVFLIQDNVSIGDRGGYFVTMSNQLNTTKVDPLLSDSIEIYAQKDIDVAITETIEKGFSNNLLLNMYVANKGIDTKDEKKVKEARDYVNGLNGEERNNVFKTECGAYYVNLGFSHTVDTKNKYNVDTSTPKIENVSLSFYDQSKEHKLKESVSISLEQNGNGKFKDTGVYLKRFFERYDAAKSFKVSWDEWCNANTAVFRGLGMLFTGQGEVSGIIGIAKVSSTTFANFGLERYLYLWGMISCNLAILNLIPFPGLDGWSLVVIGYEAITKKQIKTKVKGIISFIGLAVLFAFMIFIVIKDIIGLF